MVRIGPRSPSSPLTRQMGPRSVVHVELPEFSNIKPSSWILSCLASSSLIRAILSLACSSRSAAARRSRLTRSRRTTQSASSVSRSAPYAVAATPPTKRYSTSWRLSTSISRDKSRLGPSLIGVIQRGSRRPDGVDFSEPLLGCFFRVNSATVEEDRHVIFRGGSRRAHTLGQLAYRLHSTHRHGSSVGVFSEFLQTRHGPFV